MGIYSLDEMQRAAWVPVDDVDGDITRLVPSAKKNKKNKKK